jgi:hypothetical protein
VRINKINKEKFMAGNHTYWIPEPNSWESRSDNKADKIIDSLDATAALHLAQRAAASEAQIAAAQQFQLDQKTFLKMYPVYKDTDRNALLMKHHWENSLGVTIPSLTEIEESFFALRESGVLQPDAKAVAREDEDAVIRRAAELREAREANAFNEADAYALPFEELERRARGW